MARAIDGEVAYRFLTEQLVKETGAFSKGVNKGLNIARSAMRNPDAIPTLTQPNEGAKGKNVPTNEPLTLEELRKIDTVIPLWVHNLSWGQHKPRLMLVRHVTSNYWSCVDFDGFETIKSDDYGSRYLIYRRPPEGEGGDVGRG